MIVDGFLRFGCSLEGFYRRHEIAAVLVSLGVLSLPADVDAQAPPALARVNPMGGQARWIANCPDCRVGAEYVWLADPRFLCCTCGNRQIGGRWRRVEIPSDRKRIEAMLMARPDPDSRSWEPDEPPEQTLVDQVRLQGGGG